MRKYPTLFVLLALTPVASAHTTASEDGLATQLMHQFLGLHHMPVTALILVGGVLAVRAWYRKST